MTDDIDLQAMPEDTILFADEPIVRITARMPQAQLVETRIINLMQLESTGCFQGRALRPRRSPALLPKTFPQGGKGVHCLISVNPI